VHLDVRRRVAPQGGTRRRINVGCVRDSDEREVALAVSAGVHLAVHRRQRVRVRDPDALIQSEVADFGKGAVVPCGHGRRSDCDELRVRVASAQRRESLVGALDPKGTVLVLLDVG